ncbi:MAG: hypothetical protein ACQESN_09925 [Thermotogota bacterium]
MKYLIILIFLGLSLQSIGQDKPFYSRQFYEAMQYSHQAEMAVVRQNYEEADQIYDSVFTLMPEPAGHDVWNRAVIAKELNRKPLRDSMLVILFRKGYDVEKLSKCFDTSVLSPLITKEYISIKSEHDEFMEKIVKADQQASIRKAIDPDKWIKTSLRNIKKVMHYQNNVDSLKIPYFTLESSDLHIVITHFFQMWNNSQLAKKEGFIKRVPWMKGLANVNYASFGVISFLKDEVEKGHFSAQSLGYYIGNYIIPYPNYAYNQVDSCFFVLNEEFFDIEALNNINQHRNFLALGSNADFIQKARFMDSVRFDGKIFEPIGKEDTAFFINKYDHCSFSLVSGTYRNIRFMANPKVAKKTIQKDSIILKKQKFEYSYDFVDQ